MKKIATIASFVFSMLLMVNLSSFAADREEVAAPDSAEFRSTYSLPTEGLDLDRELASRITYPEKAIAQGIEGEVRVLCTIDTEGKVTDVKILKDIGGDCALEVAQAVRQMKFQPAIQNGYPRAFTMTIPVQFNLQ